jgi:sulfotransferase
MSGPLAGLFGALLSEMSARNEYSIFIDDAKRERILYGLFDNYYADCPAEVIFDTNRSWCAWMPAIARLFPDAKVIACVRDLPWVIDSIERLVQRNVFSPSSIFNYSSGGTVYTRANGVAGQNGMVGALPTTHSSRRATAHRRTDYFWSSTNP